MRAHVDVEPALRNVEAPGDPLPGAGNLCQEYGGGSQLRAEGAAAIRSVAITLSKVSRFFG